MQCTTTVMVSSICISKKHTHRPLYSSSHTMEYKSFMQYKSFMVVAVFFLGSSSST